MADFPIVDSIRKMPLNRSSSILMEVQVRCIYKQKCYGHLPVHGKVTRVLDGLYFDI